MNRKQAKALYNAGETIIVVYGSNVDAEQVVRLDHTDPSEYDFFVVQCNYDADDAYLIGEYMDFYTESEYEDRLEDLARHAEYMRNIKPVDDVWPSDGPLADIPF